TRRTLPSQPPILHYPSASQTPHDHQRHPCDIPTAQRTKSQTEHTRHENHSIRTHSHAAKRIYRFASTDTLSVEEMATLHGKKQPCAEGGNTVLTFYQSRRSVSLRPAMTLLQRR